MLKAAYKWSSAPLKDYVLLDEFKGLEVHLVKENTILSDNSRSHEKFIHGIKVLMAKNYIDNLSEEIRKGLLQKAQQGEYPSKPPYGYMRKPKSKDLLVVEDEARVIKKAFDYYSEGNISMDALVERLYNEGLYYSPKQPKMYASMLARIWTYEISLTLQKIQAHTNANHNYMEVGGQFLELLENLYLQYSSQSVEEKKKLLKIIFSNFILKDGKLDYTYKKPFDIIAKGASCPKWWRWRGSNPRPK